MSSNNDREAIFVITGTFFIILAVIIIIGFGVVCGFTFPIDDDPIIIVYQSNNNTDLNYYLSYHNNCSIIMVYIDDVMTDVNYNAYAYENEVYTLSDINPGNHTVKIIGIRDEGHSKYIEYLLYNDTFIFYN